MKNRLLAAAIAIKAAHAAHAQPCVDAWTQFSVQGNAPSGYTYGWAYDSLRDRIVAVNGSVSGCTVNPVREFDGTTWVLKSPATNPPPLGDFSMVFDSSRGRCVLIGGIICNTNTRVDGHWEWDGTNWQQMNIARPSARTLGAMAFDSQRGRMVLFGGEADSGPLADLWEFDGTAWTQINIPGGPSPRYAMAATYDPLTQRVILFGGRTSSAIPGGTWYNETWAWDGTAWEQLPGIDDPQLPLNYHMVPDPVTGRLIMYAFYNGGVRCYAFEGNAWTRLLIAMPPFRAWCGYVADTVRQRIVLFGGLQNSSTWKFVGASGPSIASQPQPQSLRVESTLHLSATLSGPPASSVRWYRNGSPISNGGRISGANTTNLTILFAEPGDSGPYHLLATGTACSTTSNSAQVNVWCFADLDGGQDNGVPNGAVDINDLLYFLSAFEAGSIDADLDNGTSTGTADNAVDINDLLFFLARFEAGC